ncbi:MAG: T9SS-dependent M36 family metallopeptidase [Bacteroidota bacterium]
MKKITFLALFLIPFLGFSQANNQKIQSYLNENAGKLQLTPRDINDWVIETERNSTSTNINNYYVRQRFNGTEVAGALSNFWIKSGEVINSSNQFISNISQKINATAPTLSVNEGLAKAISLLSISNSGSFQILETISQKEFKINNGVLTDEPVTAKLVYQVVDANTLKLAWEYTLYTPDYQHLWNVRIDALTGKMLSKLDMVVSCNFDTKGSHKNHNHSSADLFSKSFLKETPAISPMGVFGGNYRVIPYNYISPDDSPRQLISNPENTLASPNGWHNASTNIGDVTTTYTITRGNNVFAKDDWDGNNTGGTSPDGTASLTFDFPYPGVAVAPDTYINAANTNLFYMSNIMHDVWYQYGFTEANGNFQTRTFGRGGVGNDAVNAEAQDGSKLATPNLNNANFSTPNDGGAGRMQMYVWNVGPPSTLAINSPSGLGPYDFLDNGFTPGHVYFPGGGLTSDLVLYQDANPDATDACEVAVNAAALNGKIAVIRRGTCTFVLKVKAAQNAGAVGVIVVNNQPGRISMGGDATANGITIPAGSMTMDEGEALIAAMASGTVNVTITGPTTVFVNSDGDFDNAIVAHEYGHGISTRLVGGSACLAAAEQQGEGWSDFFALMMQMKAGDVGTDGIGIGTFVNSQPTTGPGIRQYPYSTDMSVNQHTFASTNSMFIVDATAGTEDIDQHSVGSVWAAMLWDLAWAYVGKYGYDADIYTGTGGNNKVMRLVLDGLMLQPCNSSFVDSRDAIIAADQATTGGQDFCLIWDVFARRGLGFSANSGANDTGDGISNVESIKDQTEAFDVPPPGPNCSLGVDYFQHKEMIKVFPNPSNGLVNIRINQYVGKVNLQVVDINGRVVYNTKNEDFNIEKTINLNTLQSGIYVLKIVGEQLNYSQKIILN